MSVVRNSAFNLAAMLVPTLVALVTVPLYISAMGEARYGVIALVTALTGYFGLFDFGLSAATAQRIAAAGDEDIEARRGIFWTAAGVNLALGLVGALVLFPVAHAFFGAVETMPAPLRAEIEASIGWIALAVPVMLLSGVLRGALQGAGRFAEMNLIAVIMGPVGQVLPLLAAIWLSPSLALVLPVLYAVRLVMLAWQARVVARRVLLGWAPCFELARVRDLLSFGGWVTLSALVDPLLTTIDRFLIGARIGLGAVAHYTVPYQLAQRSLVVPSALIDALLPRIASVSEADAQVLSRRAMRAVVAVMTPPMLAGIAWVHPFLELWISRSFADVAAGPARLLLAGCWLNAIGFCCFQHLRARGRPRLIATAHLIEIPPYLACLWLGMHFFGLAGAAAAFAARIAFDDAILAGFAGLADELGRLLVMALPALVLAGWLGERIVSTGALLSLESGLAAALVFASGAVLLLWARGERETLVNAFRRRDGIEAQP